MKEFTYTVQDELGLHARPAGALAKMAREYEDTMITLTKGEKTADLRRLMAVMTMLVKQGDCITIRVDGPSEEAAAEAIRSYMEQNL